MIVPEASSPPSSSIEIDLLPPRLQGLRALAEKWALFAGFSHLEAGQILAGVDEALVNIHLHSYGGRQGKVVVEIQKTNHELIFQFTDYGKSFDPKQGTGRKPGEIGEGGWGTLIMQHAFPRIERHQLGDKNILLLARPLPVHKGGV